MISRVKVGDVVQCEMNGSFPEWPRVNFNETGPKSGVWEAMRVTSVEGQLFTICLPSGAPWCFCYDTLTKGQVFVMARAVVGAE